ncbi:MAG: LysM domain protein [Labilithrix sp.]|nr:LysM domain protein [Labilithrix sp.]
MKTPAAIVALLGVALHDGSARADDPVRHVVENGDSCSSIAQRYYGDTRFVDLLHGANPELAKKPPPHLLREGMVLVIPPKPAAKAGPDAQLTAVRNQVDVLTPETKPGHPNDPLFRGNRVSTQAASAADVTFRDETQVKLGERTLVIILGDARSAAAKVDAASDTNATGATLVTGNLRAFMPSAKKDASFGTEAAAVKVYQGEAQISADAVKTTRLAVYRGSSAIEARGTRREVARGFGSKAELGHAPTAPRPLPPAPVWSTAPPLVLLDRGTASILGAYDVRTLPEATSPRVSEWHVQIARDGIFRDVAVDTRVPAAVKNLEVQPPGAGRYYIRISAVDDDHFEGPYGVIARVLVVHAVETALPGARRRLEIEPPDAFCVRVGNVELSRVDGPIVAGTKEPVRLRCAPNESDPTTLIPLD